MKYKKLQYIDTDCSFDYDAEELEYSGVKVYYNANQQKEFVVANSWDEAMESEKWFSNEDDVVYAIETGDYSEAKPFKYTKVEIIYRGQYLRISLFVPVPDASIIYNNDKCNSITKEYVFNFIKNTFGLDNTECHILV